MAVTFGWKGAVDTNILFSEFYTNDHTILIWFLPQYPRAYCGPLLSVNGTGNYIVGQGDYNNQGKTHLISRIEGANQVYLSAVFSGAVWYQLAIVRESNNIKLYLNGQILGSPLTLTNTNVPSGKLRLGRPSPGKGVDNREAQFYGMIGELAIFTRALTNNEILTNFTNRGHLTGNELDLLAGFLFLPSTTGSLPQRLLRPIVLSGETAILTNSRNWSNLDINLIPLPMHQAMELPFLSGEAWTITQGFAATFSHHGYAAFCWDFMKADVGGDWTTVYPNGSNRAPLYSTCDGTVTFVSHINPPINPGAPERDNMVWIKGADGFIRTHMHLLKNSVRVSLGQNVRNGQPIAQTCLEWLPPTPNTTAPHHHFGMIPEAADAIGDITMPCAFINYEVRQPNGIWIKWNRGIPQQGEVVRRIGPMSGWDRIGHANNVVAIAAMFVASEMKSKLFAVTKDNKLWWRDAVGDNPNLQWDHIGHAIDVVAMAASNNKLFVATKDNKLWWREPVGNNPNLQWDHIGYASNVTAMTARNGKLFAANNNNELMWRDAVGQSGTNVAWPYWDGWDRIGHANNVIAMAFWAPLRDEKCCGSEGMAKLFAVTKDNKLWWRDAVGDNPNLQWDHIGHAIDVVAMAASNNKLFAATNDDRLLWRDA